MGGVGVNMEERTMLRRYAMHTRKKTNLEEKKGMCVCWGKGWVWRQEESPCASVSKGSVPSYCTSPSATTGGLDAGAVSWQGSLASEGVSCLGVLPGGSPVSPSLP